MKLDFILGNLIIGWENRGSEKWNSRVMNRENEIVEWGNRRIDSLVENQKDRIVE